MPYECKRNCSEPLQKATIGENVNLSDGRKHSKIYSRRVESIFTNKVTESSASARTIRSVSLKTAGTETVVSEAFPLNGVSQASSGNRQRDKIGQLVRRELVKDKGIAWWYLTCLWQTRPLWRPPTSRQSTWSPSTIVARSDIARQRQLSRARPIRQVADGVRGDPGRGSDPHWRHRAVHKKDFTVKNEGGHQCDGFKVASRKI